MATVKAARQQALARLLRTRQIASQAQLRAELRAQGFDATQATVSRDLEDLAAVKARTADGRRVYALPDVGRMGGRAGPDELRRVLSLSLLEIIPAGNLLVVRTPPGHANALASTLDRAGLAGVAGTVAGDDTVLVVCTDRGSGKAMARQLTTLAGNGPPLTYRGASA